jgi:DNA-binding response OmpR family regulator
MPGRILVVEDIAAIRNILQTMLMLEGYEVSGAEDGDAALDLLEDGGPLPDLILLDLIMPHHNGWSLLATLCEHSDWQRIPVVIISSAADAEEQAARFNVFCLPKPFTGQALLNIVECYCAPPVRQDPG